MAESTGYALLDVGGGRRLERFGSRVVDRPHPAVVVPPRDPGTWRTADLRFDHEEGWRAADGDLGSWTASVEGLTIELRPTPTGQVGLFPEQADSRRWLRGRLEPGARVLNLFAYTGVASLLAAAAGAEVAHVDAARPSVAWARRNAVLSGLADRPVRWLVDDVEAFVGREVRRGHRYDAVVLDPPTYGHGARHGRRPWRIETSLPALLDGVARLLAPRAVVLLTAHTESFDADVLADLLTHHLGVDARSTEAGPLALEAASGARLPLGAYARHAP